MPDPWEFFTDQQITNWAQSPINSVRSNWPRLVEQLGHCGLNDMATQIAMIGTIGIESAHTFEPVREAFFIGEPEPAETHRRTKPYYPYYGRGYIQITHRGNYEMYGPKIAVLWGAGGFEPDFNLVGEPDRALDPDISAAVSAIYFRDHGGDGLALIPNAARNGNWPRVRELVLGSTRGWEELNEISRLAGGPVA